jgi:hypothetical protein
MDRLPSLRGICESVEPQLRTPARRGHVGLKRADLICTCTTNSEPLFGEGYPVGAYHGDGPTGRTREIDPMWWRILPLSSTRTKAP